MSNFRTPTNFRAPDIVGVGPVRELPDHVRTIRDNAARAEREAAKREPFIIPPPPAPDPLETATELVDIGDGRTAWLPSREVKALEKRKAWDATVRSATTADARAELAGRYRVLVGRHRGAVVELDASEARVMLLADLVERIEGQ